MISNWKQWKTKLRIDFRWFSLFFELFVICLDFHCFFTIVVPWYHGTLILIDFHCFCCFSLCSIGLHWFYFVFCNWCILSFISFSLASHWFHWFCVGFSIVFQLFSFVFHLFFFGFHWLFIGCSLFFISWSLTFICFSIN